MTCKWSDHYLVYADCMISSPVVQIAVPAWRLPPVSCLDDCFWSDVLEKYQLLVASPITLPTWTSFKSSVLSAGVSASRRVGRAKTKNWRAALHGDRLSSEELDDAISWFMGGAPSPADVPAPFKAAGPLRHCNWPLAAPWAASKPVAPVPSWLPTPSSPWFSTTVVPLRYRARPCQRGPAPSADEAPSPPRQPPSIPALLTARVSARRQVARANRIFMAEHHTSQWYNLSSNKEADERGSRASVSVAGLQRSSTSRASTSLSEMVMVAHSYFRDLHTPEPLSAWRRDLQDSILREVAAVYAAVPTPLGSVSGPFLASELPALRRVMHNTAPGPDGIPYSFWKSLESRVASLPATNPPLKPFWHAFLDLANDVKANGSSCCSFKLANVSLFFKKGDPTLVKNYRPISSMNTDCKLYTNLVNNRLSPWAVSKLHDDQKGFVPGRLITDHTRLASSVCHLACSTGTNGYIVGLDQAKAYDRVDHAWLLRVMSRMGLDPDLILCISDIISGCSSHVRINGGYSPTFRLQCGVRQGDPLSCLLFNFSIEPLAMRLRSVVQGISIGYLPPVKVMLYADDVNLFLRESESVEAVANCLSDSSLAIGSLFNLDKMDVKPMGSDEFMAACHTSGSMGGQLLPGAFILPPGSPLRILGVWIGSPDLARGRWTQVSSHISRLIGQWNAIGASLPNRVLLAKALLMSRCYYLMDGNGIPPPLLKKISNSILRFVRGRFSTAPYSFLEAPLAAGGLNCLSLVTRHKALDLKFISDLISGPQSAAWRRWTMFELRLASVSSHSSTSGPSLDPLKQHCFTLYTLLNPRLCSAYRSAASVGVDILCAFPSADASLRLPLLNHPGLPTGFARNHACLRSHGVRATHNLYRPTDRLRCKPCKARIANFLSAIHSSPWRPVFRDKPGADSPRMWPAMRGPYGCLRFLTGSANLFARPSGPRHARQTPKFVPPPRLSPVSFGVVPFTYDGSQSWNGAYLVSTVGGAMPLPGVATDVNVWTDGSAVDNGLETCSAGAAWSTASHISASASLQGLPLSNNVAEVAAVIMALMSWPSGPLHIHTDSSFVLHLVRGGLLALERDGWPGFPWVSISSAPAPSRLVHLFQFFLFLLRSHAGPLRFSWVKAHAGNAMNDVVDALAKDGLASGPVFRLDDLHVPPGWVDYAPVLNCQSLAFISQSLVSYSSPTPLLSNRMASFRDKWTVFFYRSFDTKVDLGTHFRRLWRLNCPPGLKDLVWRSVTGALPIGSSWYGRDIGLQFCPCGDPAPLDLFHIFRGCSHFPIQCLYVDVLWPALIATHGGKLWHKSLDPDCWYRGWWFPILCLKRLAHCGTTDKVRRALCRSVPDREWILGSFYWRLWRTRMDLAHSRDPWINLPTLAAAIEHDFSLGPR